jgi:hypothetical protein
MIYPKLKFIPLVVLIGAWGDFQTFWILGDLPIRLLSSISFSTGLNIKPVVQISFAEVVRHINTVAVESECLVNEAVYFKVRLYAFTMHILHKYQIPIPSRVLRVVVLDFLWKLEKPGNCEVLGGLVNIYEG